MSNWNSNDAGFWINAAGTSILSDISEYVNSVTHNGGNALVDDTGLSQPTHTEARDINPVNELSITFFVNSTTSAIFGPLKAAGTGASKTVQYQEGSSVYYSGSALVGSVSTSTPIGLQTGTTMFHSDSGTGFTRTSVSVA